MLHCSSCSCLTFCNFIGYFFSALELSCIDVLRPIGADVSQTTTTTALQDNLGKPAAERYRIRDFTGVRDDGVAEASAGSYAKHLHLAPGRQPCH